MALQKITTDLISADAVTAAKIADGAIGADDIATNSITSVKIAQNSILTKHIDDDQVTGDQLADAITVVTSVTSPLLVATSPPYIPKPTDGIIISDTEYPSFKVWLFNPTNPPI